MIHIYRMKPFAPLALIGSIFMLDVTFLIIPNVLSFSVLLVTFVTIQTQVRLEEEYLETVQGEVYLEYKRKVRRWL